MEQINQEQFLLIINDFVKLSQPMECPNCHRQTKLVGETKKFGNWICGFCLHYFPYKDNQEIEVEVPFIKLTNQLDISEPQHLISSLSTQPLGVAPVDFPMDITTGFLVPSYSGGYTIERKRNVLLAQAIDFTRFGRIKSGIIWQFDLGYDDRTVDEYETLISFADTQGNHLPFNYTDPFRQSSHICYLESDVSPAKPASFDGVSFSIKISE
jgi:hypothetical protein